MGLIGRTENRDSGRMVAYIGCIDVSLTVAHERVMAESRGMNCWYELHGRSFGCASCKKPQDSSLRMTVLR